jgi:ribosome-associated heat shock protein Hsp15
LTAVAVAPERAKTRLDQWLWFARLAKSRSLAARLCAAGAIAVNGSTVTKPNQSVRVGDFVVVPQGGVQRTVQVLALGLRRGPATEARTLYRATAVARLRNVPPDWVPLLGEDDATDRFSDAPSGALHTVIVPSR